MRNLINDLNVFRDSRIKLYPVPPLQDKKDIEKLMEMIKGEMKIAIGSRESGWEMILDLPREIAKELKFKFAEDNEIELVSEVSPILVCIDNMYIANFEENVINSPSFFGRQDSQGNIIERPFDFEEQNLSTLGLLCREVIEGNEYNYILSEYIEKYLKEYVKKHDLIGKAVIHGDTDKPEKTRINTWMDLAKI